MQVVQVVVTGLLFGGIYALIAMPLNLIFGTMRVIHFAYGDFLMMAMFATLFLSRELGLSPYKGGFIVVALIFVVVGLLAHLGVFGWLVNRHYTIQIIGTLAVGIILQNVALSLWSADVQSVQTEFSTSSIDIAGIRLAVVQVIAFCAAVVVAAGLLLFLNKTHWGRAMTAVSQDRLGAQVVGIPIRHVYAVATVVSTAMLGLTGAFLLPIFSVHPVVGVEFITVAFVVVVLGGMGSVGGSLAAAVIVGLVQSFTSFYAGVQWQNTIYLVLFILILIIRPAGLAGIRGTEELGHV